MEKFRPGSGTPEYDIPSDEIASEVRLGEGDYPAFRYAAGPAGVGIGDKLFIDSGEEPREHDLSHLFVKEKGR